MRNANSEVIGLYETMVRIRGVELAQSDLWERGLVSGEMHTGIGEEGIIAGVTAHLRAGDSVACDHRPTGVFVARGSDIGALLLEMVGHEDGLNRGWGGHMHLMDAERLLAADGIVGSSGPAACGFALAAEQLRPGSVAVAFFGEGALNQGMLMESFNLAVVWRLPVLFVCKDNRWSITTRTSRVTAGTPLRRAAAFELRRHAVNGSDAVRVGRVAGRMIDRIRADREPAFLHARCLRPDGHLLRDPMLRVLRDPLGQARELGAPLAGAVRRPGGASRADRARALSSLGRRVTAATAGQARQRSWDPVARMRRRLDAGIAEAIERRVGVEVDAATEQALAAVGEAS